MQQTEIRDYLLSKNLPIDLLMEVQDHFINQIETLQRDDKTFDEAFQKTKDTWFKELRFSRYKIQFDLNDVTQFEKKFKTQKQRQLLKNSLAVGLVIIFLLYVLTLLLPFEVYSDVFIVIIAVVVLTPIIFYYENYKLFRLAKTYGNYKLTLSQNATTISLVTCGSTGVFLHNVYLHGKSIYQTFQAGPMDSSLVITLLFLLMIWLNVFCLLSQRDYLKQIRPIKPFLKYLKAS